MSNRKAAFEIPAHIPQGFILSDSGMYSFMDQDIFPDILSFITAIPDHLKPLFLIPVKVDHLASKYASDGMVHIAVRIASSRMADDFIPSGDTPEGDYFGTKTFVYDDQEPTVAPSDPGSIFDIDGADERTHHQDLEINQDINDQSGTDASYMSDVDLTESYIKYPYRTEESPLRHSAIIPRIVPRIGGYHIALEPYELENKTPDKIKDNANSCTVALISYDKKSRTYTFNVGCGGSSHTVQAKLNDKDHVALNCDCEFWRWNGPEYHAKSNDYLLGAPSGTASPPDIRDPERQFHLCKHAYAVTARIDEFVEEISDENPDASEEEILDKADSEWDRMEGVAEVDLEEAQENDVDAEIEDEGIELDGDADEAVDDGDGDDGDDDAVDDDDDDSDFEIEDENNEDLKNISESMVDQDDEEPEDIDEESDDLADIAESMVDQNDEELEDDTEDEEDK